MLIGGDVEGSGLLVGGGGGQSRIGGGEEEGGRKEGWGVGEERAWWRVRRFSVGIISNSKSSSYLLWNLFKTSFCSSFFSSITIKSSIISF